MRTVGALLLAVVLAVRAGAPARLRLTEPEVSSRMPATMGSGDVWSRHCV